MFLNLPTLVLPTLLSLVPLASAQGPSTPPAREPRDAERPVAPPVPVELMAGNAYASLNLVLSGPFASASRWGVFHQGTPVAGYSENEEDDMAMQSLLTFTPRSRFRLTAGAFYGSVHGVSPPVGIRPKRRRGGAEAPGRCQRRYVRATRDVLSGRAAPGRMPTGSAGVGPPSLRRPSARLSRHPNVARGRTSQCNCQARDSREHSSLAPLKFNGNGALAPIFEKTARSGPQRDATPEARSPSR
jgi:hypothetical protein